MPPSGRKLSDVWEAFNRKPYKKGYQGTCKVCNSDILGKKELLLKHLTSCVLVDDETKEWAKQQMETLSEDKKRKAPPPPAKTSKVKQMAFTVKSMPSIDAKEQEALDIQLVRFIASANIPFQVVGACSLVSQFFLPGCGKHRIHQILQGLAGKQL